MSKSKVSRDELIKLAQRIHDCQDRGENYSSLLSQLQAHVPYPSVDELVLGDYSAEYVVDFSLNWQADWPRLSKEEMIGLVNKIVKAEGTAPEQGLMIQKFAANCLHPAQTDLIYFPAELAPWHRGTRRWVC